MLKFVSTPREKPKKRPSKERKNDFFEIEPIPTADELMTQSSRCSQCGVPTCQIGCPLENQIPDWLKASALGREEEAWEYLSETNSFPEICGRICPQDRLCEGSCVIERGFGAVTIGAIEKKIAETAWANNWVEKIIPINELEKSVGIVGAGPAGLAAALKLRKKGYQVVIYDRYDRGGGLLMYGIPSFKMEKSIITRQLKRLEESNVKFKFGIELGRNETIANLKENHDALLLAIGAYKPKKLQMDGGKFDNVIRALDYLIHENQIDLGDFEGKRKKVFDAKGKKVVIIGGGDTAMDCCRTAIRQGAESVICLYRRDQENMPGSVQEVQHAKEEGVKFHWRSGPEKYLGNNTATGILVYRTRVATLDESQRQSPIKDSSGMYELQADMIIEALGFEVDNIETKIIDQENAEKLELNLNGTIAVNENLESNIKGIFAAGDVVRGASLVVWAIKDGHTAANSIHKFLSDQ